MFCSHYAITISAVPVISPATTCQFEPSNNNWTALLPKFEVKVAPAAKTLSPPIPSSGVIIKASPLLSVLCIITFNCPSIPLPNETCVESVAVVTKETVVVGDKIVALLVPSPAATVSVL